MKNSTLLLFIVLLGCNSTPTHTNRFQSFGVSPHNGPVKFAVVNNADCINCLAAVRNFFDILKSGDLPDNFYVILPALRDPVYNKFVSDYSIDPGKVKIIRSDELVNTISKDSNIKEFTSFFSEYDSTEDHILKTQILKELNSDADFSKLFAD
jgi:hypothetical protein